MDSKEIIRKFYEEVITRNELERVEDYVSSDCVVRIGNDTFLIGTDGMKEHIAATKVTYPDYTMRILRQFQDGDTVISDPFKAGRAARYLYIVETDGVPAIRLPRTFQ